MKTPAGIAIVDDSKFFRDFLRITFERLGYQVDDFDDPKVADARLRTGGNAFKALITDFEMPGMN